MSCNLEGTLCQIVLGEWAMQIRGERLKNVDADASRGSQSRTRWNFRSKKKIGSDFTVHFLKDRDRDFQGVVVKAHISDVVPTLEHTKVGRDHLNATIRSFTQNRVKILVDRCTKDSTAELLRVRRQIGSPAAKANPNWTANYEHESVFPREWF